VSIKSNGFVARKFKKMHCLIATTRYARESLEPSLRFQLPTPVNWSMTCCHRDESSVPRADVVRGGTDQLVVDALLNYVRGPAGCARDHE
jgi:hypothetical protein